MAPATLPNHPARPQLVFIGSGPVAAESLELLLDWCDVEAVITKPQPPHHRQIFPVIRIAQAHNLPTHYATNRRELDTVIASIRFSSQAAVLVDFGIIVSQTVIDSFPLGIINSHFSLLPEWRGADPISFAILSGQAQTGVSLMLLVQAMDEGPLLGLGVQDITASTTTPTLTEQLIQLSNTLLRDTIPAYLTGQPIQPASQEDAARLMGRPFQPTYSRKLSKADGVLDFNKPAVELERQVRAFLEWPKSRTTLAGKDIVVTKAHVETDETISSLHREIGQPHVTGQKTIAIPTSAGLFVIDELKPAGKGAMSAAAFLAGNQL